MISRKLESYLVRSWYQSRIDWLSILLLPFSCLFYLIVFFRRQLYRLHIFNSQRLFVPVIVVGNISVGGTGKTPFVIWLANLLREQHIKAGIISRGYSGQVNKIPMNIDQNSRPEQVGEEAILIFKKTNCPVVVARDRFAAAQQLLKEHNCDVIISDDGLQHYALAREMEIILIDGERRLGNGYCLPAGPLREPKSRLAKADFIVVTHGNVETETVMQLVPQDLVAMNNPQRVVDKLALKARIIHAVAGIGHPERFFQTLRGLKLRIFEHVFPDHHQYTPQDLNFGSD